MVPKMGTLLPAVLALPYNTTIRLVLYESSLSRQKLRSLTFATWLALWLLQCWCRVRYSTVVSTQYFWLTEQATYDSGAIYSITNSSSVLRISFSPEPSDLFPAIWLMIGVMASVVSKGQSGVSQGIRCLDV
jgi:hypothetical protein